MPQTRTVHNDDGTTEVIRVLDDQALMTFEEWNPIAYEASIVWLEDIAEVDFVRFMLATKCDSRAGKLIPDNTGRIIGYSKLLGNAPANPDGFYTRRVFFRFAEDESNLDPPKGSVDPLTVAPGVTGESLKRKPVPSVKHWKIRVNDPRIHHALQGQTDVETRRNREALLGALLPDKGKPTLLMNRQLLIGRDRFCDVCLANSTVSSEHCRLTFDSGTWSIMDLGSTAGTWINGRRIRAHDPIALQAGDRIAVAGFQVKIEY